MCIRDSHFCGICLQARLPQNFKRKHLIQILPHTCTSHLYMRCHKLKVHVILFFFYHKCDTYLRYYKCVAQKHLYPIPDYCKNVQNLITVRCCRKIAELLRGSVFINFTLHVVHVAQIIISMNSLVELFIFSFEGKLRESVPSFCHTSANLYTPHAKCAVQMLLAYAWR